MNTKQSSESEGEVNLLQCGEETGQTGMAIASLPAVAAHRDHDQDHDQEVRRASCLSTNNMNIYIYIYISVW